MSRHFVLVALSISAWATLLVSTAAAAETGWPPALPKAIAGTATLRSRQFLAIPANVQEARSKEGAADFVMAKSLSTLELAYHGNLGESAATRRLWSCWGDICLASDGRVYVGIGDHGDDAGGDARCFIYQWDPATKVLKQVVDVNSLLPDTKPHSRWSKMHAKIDEGPDGMIYFSATLNDGNRAGKENFHWSDQTPGGQLYRYDPKTGNAEIFASLPAKRCTATSLLDRERNLWWCNLEAGEGGALFALDLSTRKPVFQAADGSMGFNRNFALAKDGAIYFNGADALWKYDPKANNITRLKSTWGDSPGMRCSTAETSKGEIYGITHKSTQLFRYRPAQRRVDPAGPELARRLVHGCLRPLARRAVRLLPAGRSRRGVQGRHAGRAVRNRHRPAESPRLPGRGVREGVELRPGGHLRHQNQRRRRHALCQLQWPPCRRHSPGEYQTHRLRPDSIRGDSDSVARTLSSRTSGALCRSLRI